MTAARVLVTGATGVVGRLAIPQLLARGHRVSAVGSKVDDCRAAVAHDRAGWSGDTAGRAGSRRPVDPDHVGSHVGQHHGGEGRRADPGQLDNGDSGQGSGHRAQVGHVDDRVRAVGVAVLRR